MRVLQRIRVLAWWFAGQLPCFRNDDELALLLCGACGETLNADGSCERCDASELAFFSE